MAQQISFWLIPALEDQAFFQQIIDRLAAQYDAPRFAPHVTLYFGTFAAEGLPELMQQVVQIVQPAQSLELQVDRLLYTDQFTKTLFVQFHPQPVLTQLSQALEQGAIDPPGFSLNPHLSLTYKLLDSAEKQQLVSEISLPQPTIRFDRLWAVSTPATVQCRADVESWQVLRRVKLSG